MKKSIIITLVAVLILALGIGAWWYVSNKDKDKDNGNDYSEPSIEDVVKNETKNEQNNLIFSNIEIREYGATNIVSGKVKNIDSKIRNIEITLKMFNSKTSRILGKEKITLENLGASEERNFEVSIMGDYTVVDKFELTGKDI